MAPNDTPVPEGWWPIEENGANGKTVKCYMNELGQQFETMKDLMCYVTYAKMAKVSIYSPDYVSSEAKKPEKLNPKRKKGTVEVSDPSFENDKKRAKEEDSDLSFDDNKENVEPEVSSACFQNDNENAEQVSDT